MQRDATLQDRSISGIHRILGEVSTLDPHRIAEQGAMRSLRRHAAEPLIARIDQALEWIDDVEQAYQPLGGDHTDPRTAGPSHRRVTETCFAARAELRAALRALTAPLSSWDEQAAACDAAASMVRRATAALVDAVSRRSETEHHRAARARRRELSRAIAVRSMYAAFRGSIPGCSDTGDRSRSRSLSRIAAALAGLIGSPNFRHVRLADRTALLGLQRRLWAWWENGRDPQEGARLYQDVVATAEVLRGINLRQELREHDARLISWARMRLAARDTDGEELDALWSQLADLRGRDDRFDRLLAGDPGSGPASVGELAAALDRLYRSTAKARISQPIEVTADAA